ncbi:hypothetical protein PtA15_6A386 [Puccinia triticina]|uniref:Rapamycin-insensitive companion of mTOR domain-containing protein n=1 Tax=Puccinia triticina TaxID=208348 RepID=A0ABY7CP36_9BASI|nr:uncharacterized protein PtA15_6A386 [Puccinia triticina]WAQ85757.1 hypothetical protein PtA15_6A386 [Puccinia triticina]WAR55634.1 hypothetical protein PtB15_6B377 [Puccinia triticina]
MPVTRIIFIFFFIGSCIILDTVASLPGLTKAGRVVANTPPPKPPDLAIENASRLKSTGKSAFEPQYPLKKATTSALPSKRRMEADPGPKASHDSTPQSAPHYWHPYVAPSKNRFATEAQKVKVSSLGQTSGKRPVRTRRNSAFKWIGHFFSQSKSTKRIEKEEALREAAGSTDKTTSSPTVKLFEDLFRQEKTVQGRLKLAQEAVDYLTKTPSLQEKELGEWVAKIIKIAKSGSGHNLQLLSTLFYGLHSVVLKNYNNEILRISMISKIDQGVKRIRVRWGSTIVTEWDQELFNPSAGLSAKIGNWKKLHEIITLDSSLGKIRMGLNNEDSNVIQKWEDIKPIFAKSTMHNYSAETRVAAIGALSEIMKREAAQRGNNNAAFKFALELSTDPEKKDAFLFNHEQTLLTKLVQNYQQPAHLSRG